MSWVPVCTSSHIIWLTFELYLSVHPPLLLLCVFLFSLAWHRGTGSVTSSQQLPISLGGRRRMSVNLIWNSQPVFGSFLQTPLAQWTTRWTRRVARCPSERLTACNNSTTSLSALQLCASFSLPFVEYNHSHIALSCHRMYLKYAWKVSDILADNG